MATQSTPQKTVHRVERQRIERGDAEEISQVARDNDDNLGLALACDFACVLYGLTVGAPSGLSFPITKGAVTQDGKLLKQAAGTAILLEANGSSDPRIDVIYVKQGKEDLSDNHNPRVLSALTRETASALVIGTGDGVTTTFTLAHSIVDPRTLKVSTGLTQLGGWSFSMGTGPLGQDEIIFGAAPAGGSIVASYNWINGGIEATASNQPSRKIRRPDYFISKGIPASTPLVPNTPSPGVDVILAHVTIPGSWSGGSGGVSVNNTIKDFMVWGDSENLSATPQPPRTTARPGALAGAIRGIDQIRSGMRMLYSDTDTNKIKITPGWGVAGGVAYTLHEITEFTINAGNVGWNYIYLDISRSHIAPPGSPVVSLTVSQQAPDVWGRERTENYYAPYVGAVYVTSTSPTVIRKFYTHGNWVMWEDTSPIGIPSSTPWDMDVTSWCPKTGRLLYTRTDISCKSTAITNNSTYVVNIQSHLEASGRDAPLYQTYASPVMDTGSDATTKVAAASGIVRAEESLGFRYVHALVVVGTGITEEGGSMHVLGYLDDYRTLDNTAQPFAY